MKIQLASDLHLDRVATRYPGLNVVTPAAGVDALVLAGDIHSGLQALDIFGDWKTPVVYVFGNHEYHGYHAPRLKEAMRRRAEGSMVTFLDDSVHVLGTGINSIRFIGATLWTDYRLYLGAEKHSLAFANRHNPDHTHTGNGTGHFTAEDAQQAHRQSREFITDELKKSFAGKTVVVSHHAPHRKSITRAFEGHPLNPAFISDLGQLMGGPLLWVHGHVHSSCDYRIGGTRVVANPCGYPLNLGAVAQPAHLEFENPHFQPELILDLG